MIPSATWKCRMLRDSRELIVINIVNSPFSLDMIEFKNDIVDYNY